MKTPIKIALATAAAFSVACLVVWAQGPGPVVTSDKADYAPGETAVFTASGFQPNELLDFSVGVSDNNGGWLPDIAWADVPADASGGAEVEYLVPQTWLGKTLQLTVMGLSSSLIATTTFTDAVAPPVTISASPAPPVDDGTTVTFTAALSASPAPTPACGVMSVQISTDGGTTFADVGSKVCAPASTTYDYNTTGHCTDSPAPQFRAHFDPGSGGTLHCDTCGGAYTGSNGDPLTVTINCLASPTPTATVEPSATPTPTACMNQSPTITCASPTPNLGKVLGCLNGGVFSQTIPVSFSTDPANGIGTSVTVKATFTVPLPSPSPTTSPVTVDVATVTDPDGDSVTVTLANFPTSLTFNGPGSDMQSFSVDIEATDDSTCPMHNTADSTCGGTASADVVYHVHYLPPLSDTATTKVKQRSTVPVKVQLTDCMGIAITPNNIPGDLPTLCDIQYISGAVPTGDPVIDNAGNSGDTCNPICSFRWADGFLLFNLQTDGSYNIGTTYGIWPCPVDEPAMISIK